MALVAGKPEVLEPRPHLVQAWLPWLRWVPSSASHIREVEEELLGHLGDPGTGSYVSAGEVGGQEVRVWTRRWEGPAQPLAPTTPLVLVHGMGAGLAMFALNIPELARERAVLAIDLPGFGRSSRPPFSCKEEEIISEYVSCLDAWREGAGLERMHLLGHSFGGFLAAHYSQRHPDRVEKVILADPWGMMPRPEDIVEQWELSYKVRAIFGVLRQFNPLGILRAAGPWGPGLATSRRPDLAKKFTPLLGEEKSVLVNNYLYHCNAHRAEGETAFKRLSQDFFWARSPVLPSLQPPAGSWTMLLGEQSWIGRAAEGGLPAFQAHCHRLGLDLHLLPEAGHHIYADRAKLFNQLVNKALGDD